MATLSAGSSVTLSLDAWASITLVVQSKATMAFTSAAPNLHSDFTVSNAASQTYGPYGVPMSVVITAVDRSVTYTVNGETGGLSYDDDGDVNGWLGSDGALMTLSEVAPGVTALTASGLAHTGVGEFLGISVTAYSGGPQTITVYDATSATGTPIATYTVSGIGFYGWASDWTTAGNGHGAKRPLTTGCYVAISGGTSRTVEVLVG